MRQLPSNPSSLPSPADLGWPLGAPPTPAPPGGLADADNVGHRDKQGTRPSPAPGSRSLIDMDTDAITGNRPLPLRLTVISRCRRGLRNPCLISADHPTCRLLQAERGAGARPGFHYHLPGLADTGRSTKAQHLVLKEYFSVQAITVRLAAPIFTRRNSLRVTEPSRGRWPIPPRHTRPHAARRLHRSSRGTCLRY